jgi:DNA processing protein
VTDKHGIDKHGTDRHETDKHGTDKLAWIALGYLVEPGNRELGLLVRRVGPVEALDRLVAGGVSERLRDAVAVRLTARGRGVDPVRLAEAALERAERLGVRILTPQCDEWPRTVGQLATISRDGTANGSVDRDTDPPLCIWVRGGVALDEAFDRAVAMVGARACSHYGTQVATDLSYGLAERGWTVVSGGAYGIDAAAHRAALSAGGITVAVLACGIDRPYPAGHASLFDHIADEGLLISEWPPGAAPHRHRFLIRNRLIAAATRGTVVVEAGSRSGARQTLGRARRLGRVVMAVPGPVTSAMSVGCHAELRTLDTRLVTSASEIIEEVGRIGDDLAPIPRGADRPHDALDPLSSRILDAVLPRKPRSAEQIAAAAGVSAREARRALPFLLAGGFVVANQGAYRLAPAPRAAGPG